MRPRISIRDYVCPSSGLLVFFDSAGVEEKWSKMNFYMSAGFLFQSFTLNLYFNITYNLSFAIVMTQTFFDNRLHNISHTIFLSHLLFHFYCYFDFYCYFHFYFYCFTIFLLQSLFSTPLFRPPQNFRRIAVHLRACYG